MEEVDKLDVVDENKGRKFMVKLPPNINAMLEDIIVPFYRASSAGHAVRLLIEDAANSINSEGNKITLDRRSL